MAAHVCDLNAEDAKTKAWVHLRPAWALAEGKISKPIMQLIFNFTVNYKYAQYIKIT